MFVRIERAENAKHTQHFQTKRLLTLALQYVRVRVLKTLSPADPDAYLDQRQQNIEQARISHEWLDDEAGVLGNLTQRAQCNLEKNTTAFSKQKNHQQKYMQTCRFIVDD